MLARARSSKRQDLARFTPGLGHWVDLFYALGAAIYIALFAALAVFFCVRFVYPWMAMISPAAVAMGLAGLLAAVVTGLAVCGVFGSSILPSTAERSKLRNMQLGAWTASS